jgi:hypothetical protein
LNKIKHGEREWNFAIARPQGSFAVELLYLPGDNLSGADRTPHVCKPKRMESSAVSGPTITSNFFITRFILVRHYVAKRAMASA